MFSPVIVCPQKGVGVVPGLFQGVSGYVWSQVPSWGGVGMFRVCGYVQGCSMSGEVGISKGRGYVQRGTHPLLRPSGDNHMYGQHVGSTHPTGMLSCYTFIQTGSIVLGTSVYKVKIIRFAQSFAFNFDGPNFLNLSSLTQ